MAARKRARRGESDPKSASTQTPADKPTAPPQTERIAHIVELMVTVQWVTGKTGKELADKWGLQQQTVRKDAAMASKLIKEGLGDPQELMARLAGSLEHIAMKATASGEYGPAVQAIKAHADITGAKKPDEVNVSFSLGELLATEFEDDPGPESEDGSAGSA